MLVFANGDLPEIDWIRPLLPHATAIIAADGGGNHVARLGNRPDVLIGDMDSISEELLAGFEAAGTEVVRYAAEKDETDLELALLYADRHYPDDAIYVLGVLGGRLDQTLANVLLLAHPQLLGRPIRLVEPFQQAWIVNDRVAIDGEIGDTVSLIPLGGTVIIETTAGLKWPLDNERLVFGPARGVSNVIVATPAAVKIKAGQVLCIHTARHWKR